MKKFFITLISSVLFFANAQGGIKRENIIYKEDKSQLEGVLVYDSASKKPRPGVIVVPNWMGVGEGAIARAEQLAQMGYVAFVADIYGQGIRPKNAEEAGKLAGSYKADRVLLRARAKAAYDVLAKNDLVQKNKMAAIGFCFGGTTVLEMARAGLPLVGVVSFHGGLDTPNEDDAKAIKAKVLVAHGAIDPYVPQKEVDQFLKEMNDAKVDYQFNIYSGAVHAFTEKAAGNDITKGAAYNAAADKKSFRAMKEFFAEVF